MICLKIQSKFVVRSTKISPNVTKTKCMFFHNRMTSPLINLSINNANVEKVIKLITLNSC